MSENKGLEISPQRPGWVRRNIKDSNDNEFYRIIQFFLINTPCEDLSTSSISISDYSWGKDVWKKSTLKSQLFAVASLERGITFIVAKTTESMKKACEKADLMNNFHTKRNTERIVIYKPSRYNECMAIFYHIRNSLAHGRFTQYEDKGCSNSTFVFEDGINWRGSFQVRSRMILRKSTLLSWIRIIKNEPGNNLGLG